MNYEQSCPYDHPIAINQVKECFISNDVKIFMVLSDFQ